MLKSTVRKIRGNMKTAMSKKLAIALATMLLLIQPVFGQASFGVLDCGQWISRKNNTDKAWVLGYMTGLSVMTTIANTKQGDWLNKVNSAEQIFLFVDNYCQKNPLKTVEDAGYALFSELIKK